MNNYLNEFGSFQRNVGVASATVNLIPAYIMGGIFILIGLICIWAGFMVTDTSTHFACRQDGECNMFEEKCVNNKCSKPGQRHYVIGTIAGLIFILLAALIIIFSKKNYDLAKTNKSYAQLNAIAPEVNLLENLFK